MLERGEGRFAEDDMVMISPWTCFCFWDVRTYKVGELFFMYNILGFTEGTLKRAVSIFQSSEIAQPRYVTSSLLLQSY